MKRSFAIALLLFLVAAAPTTKPSGSKFLRFVRDANDAGASLQASVVRYENADGVSVDLVAAIHIADPSFFEALDSSFDDYDAVLYERVQPKSTTQPAKRTFGLMLASWSQYLMSDAMGLEHQLSAVRYKNRANFIHADMDLETFQQRQKERGESMLGGARRAQGGLSRADQDRVGRDVLIALISPDRPARLKMAIGEMFGRTGDATVDRGEGEPTVIIDERNRVALNVLKDVLANQKEKRTIAIFYGAGHLNGMDEILTEEMGFRQVGPPMWRVAWDIPVIPKPATRPTARSTTRPTTRQATGAR